MRSTAKRELAAGSDDLPLNVAAAGLSWKAAVPAQRLHSSLWAVGCLSAIGNEGDVNRRFYKSDA